MTRWEEYLRSLSYSPISVASQDVGLVYGFILEVGESRFFMQDLAGFDSGDVFKIQFLSSRLNGVKFWVKVVRKVEKKIEAVFTGFEIDYCRYPMTELQPHWEKLQGLA